MTTDEGLRVTLLGTGTPIPRPDRFGPSTLIEAGGQKILIDAGRGATMRLYQLGVPMGRVNALLLTHFHSDHTTGIPDFWLTGWLSSFYARRTAPLHVFGPTGAKELISNLEKAYAADIKIRLVDEKPLAAAALASSSAHNPPEDRSLGHRSLRSTAPRRIPVGLQHPIHAWPSPPKKISSAFRRYSLLFGKLRLPLVWCKDLKTLTICEP
jgi:ribonuclease BN (tRNA processing enzyme)